MDTSLLIEQLKNLSKDLWGAIRRGESISNWDRMQLENAVVLLQMSSLESKYRNDEEHTKSGDFDGGQFDPRYRSTMK